MDKFPENRELVEFFGGEPVLDDSDVVWAYNRLSFSTALGEERVDCVIDNPEIEVRWFRQDVELAYVAFESVQELRVQDYPGGKSLVVQGVGPKQDLTLRLQLKPRVHLAIKSIQ